MLIISHDRLTIIDTDNGASFTAEEPYPGMGYTIFANYQTCGKRVLCPDIDLELAKDLMKHLFNELTQNRHRMFWNRLKTDGEAAEGGTR